MLIGISSYLIWIIEDMFEIKDSTKNNTFFIYTHTHIHNAKIYFYKHKVKLSYIVAL